MRWSWLLLKHMRKVVSQGLWLQEAALVELLLVRALNKN
jgi:hypothetical protein